MGRNADKLQLTQDEKLVLADYQTALKDLHNHLRMVERFPHEGQYPILKAVFGDKKKIVVAQFGRSAGKTESALYIGWRKSRTRANSLVYIVTPELDQGREIYIASGRLENYGPKHFLREYDTVNKTEARLYFKNGSIITIVGCKNINALRGVKPTDVIYDEFQHHSQEFDEEIMQPNLARGTVTLVTLGTPPKRKCYYTEFKENIKERIALGDDSVVYLEFPTSVNPVNDKEWLEQKKQELIKKERHAVWLREYEGKDAFDQEGAIFPMFSEERHVLPQKKVEKLIDKRLNEFKWFGMFDPGTSTVFGVLLIAWNPYTGEVVLLDELYETDRARCTASAMWIRTNELKKLYFTMLDRWINVFDEAAAWFANEVFSAFGSKESVNLISTKKYESRLSNQEASRPGESLLMDIMLAKDKFIVSERCVNFIEEMRNFVRDEKGKYPKKHDHLIDCLYYFALSSGYSLNLEETEAEREKRMFEGRAYLTPEQFMHEKRKNEDLMYSLESQENFFEDAYDGEAAWII